MVKIFVSGLGKEPHGTEPHAPFWDRGEREDGTYSRADFAYDETRDRYVCPAGNLMKTTGGLQTDGRTKKPRMAISLTDPEAAWVAKRFGIKSQRLGRRAAAYSR